MIEVRVNAYIFKEEVIRFSWNVSNPTATPFTLQFPEMRASILLKVEKVSNYVIAKGDEVLIYDAKGRKRITLLVESFTYLESKGEIELTCEPYLGQLLLEDGIYDISQVKGFDGIVASETIDKGRYFCYFENEKDYLLARAWSNEYRRDIVPIPFYIYSQSPSQQENERFRYYRPNKSPAPTLQVSDDDIIEYEISSPQPAVTHIKTRQGGRGELHTKYEFPNINKSTDSVNVHTLKGGELYAVEVYKVVDSKIEHKLYWSDGIVTTIDSSQDKVDVIGITRDHYVEMIELDEQNVSRVRVRNRINSQILLDNGYATGIEKYGIEDSITVVLPSEGTTKKYLLLYGALFANKKDLSKITLGFVISVGASVSISLVEWTAVDEIGTVAQSILRHTVTPDMQLRKVEATADYVRLFYCELTDINDTTYIRYIEAKIELSNMLAYGIQSESQVVDGRLQHSPISSVEFNGSKVSLLVNDAYPIAQVDFQMSSLVGTYFAPLDLPFYAMSFIPDLKLNGNYVAFDNEGNVYTFSRLDYLVTYYFNVAVIDSVGYLNRYVDKVGIYETNYWMATHRSDFFIDERLYLGNKAEPLPTNQSRKVCEGITNEFIAGYIIGNLQNCDLDLIEQEKGRITLTIASFKYYYYLYQTVKVEDFDLPPLMGRIYVVIDGVNYIIRTTSVRLEYNGMYKCIINGIIV